MSAPLPQVRGTYQFGAALKDLVWFRAGGVAEVLFRPADADDLAAFFAGKPAGVPITIIGVGSNLLVRDGGIPGVVIRLPAAFGKVEVDGLRVRAGAAALDSAVARKAADAGIAGFEFLRGVPGTIGGALRMNAGCYGSEVKDIFVEATAIDGQGKKHVLSAADMGFVYRKSGVPKDFVFVEAVFEGHGDEPAAVRTRMEELLARREITQPIGAKTGGSTFKNPPGAHAWKLIEDAGCRGLKIGDAMVSDVHCNFLINLGNATAAEIEALGEEVRRRVKETSGIDLEWEIKRVGVAGGES
ncbi:UDP-N-acetylmuramate dehydrogenase [Rhizomicrobium palustre]|uniref:UDP-N-acetylenolpyruvoylglucosamine reductase n=1 Tax=Rhizomicrobium palustre TaxID=189966 RepID=A0A846MW93_9PROT|nr:UDP-N-acetylmuramate dehydrogenase [Rhizomicrobium palustre]NIK87499.1 UDP-N-acetylmuramate dehydrogenase [Rhizomicrobium palustre]